MAKKDSSQDVFDRYQAYKDKQSGAPSQNIDKPVNISNSGKIYKYFVVGLIGIIVIANFGLLSDYTPQFGNRSDKTDDGDYDFIVYSSPTCSCCAEYVVILEDLGYSVNSIKTNSYTNIKDERNIPADSRSCHTTLYGNYFIEGHVPISVINQLIAENPDIDGIALPGMPAGSPGMGGDKTETFEIQSIKSGVVVSIFARV
ncbi:MAG: hypothetical protein OEY49_07125 [Candidatus Heimdallarchaeota archaeon]|nr:hypothetical protein [Candidatus Heimdallarchaeota archaeon]